MYIYLEFCFRIVYVYTENVHNKSLTSLTILTTERFFKTVSALRQIPNEIVTNGKLKITNCIQNVKICTSLCMWFQN